MLLETAEAYYPHPSSDLAFGRGWPCRNDSEWRCEFGDNEPARGNDQQYLAASKTGIVLAKKLSRIWRKRLRGKGMGSRVRQMERYNGLESFGDVSFLHCPHIETKFLQSACCHCIYWVLQTCPSCNISTQKEGEE